MSVPVGQRTESKLQVFTKATELVKHTLECTKNNNIFKPDFSVLTDRINANAFAIGEDIWRANDIKVASSSDLDRRKQLQRDALVECDAMLYNLTLAKRIFHLSGRRYEYWVGLIREVKVMIRAWRDSDASRYRHLKSGM